MARAAVQTGPETPTVSNKESRRMANRSFVSGRFYFTLDGAKCGWVKSVEGGAITADVIEEKLGPSYFTKKHLGNVKYEDIKMEVGMSMTQNVYKWIESSWNQDYQRRSGSIIATDHNLKSQTERHFYQALISETTVPAMDGASKEPCYMTLSIAPEWSRVLKGSGTAVAELGGSEQKFWSASNFRLEIDGLDCSRVNKIDAFTIKQAFKEDEIGDARDYAKEPGSLTFPNLKISLSTATAETWTKWHEEFVIKGNNTENFEKNGALIFLSPNRETELARIEFFNLGIFKCSKDANKAAADTIDRTSAELYCERMQFKYSSATIA
jgi:phage tail-like protein